MQRPYLLRAALVTGRLASDAAVFALSLGFASPAFAADGIYKGTSQTEHDLSGCPSGRDVTIALLGHDFTYDSSSGLHFSGRFEEGHNEGDVRGFTHYTLDIVGNEIKGSFSFPTYAGGHRIKCVGSFTANLEKDDAVRVTSPSR